MSNDLHGHWPFQRLMPADHRKAETISLSGETLPFFDTCLNLADGIAQEADKRRLPGVAVKGVSGLFEFDAVEKALDVTRDRVSGHDEGCVESVNIFTRYRPFRVTNKSRDRNFCEAKIIRNTCEAMP